MNEISLNLARKIISAAFELAEQNAEPRATVVVTDKAGAVIALERNDASAPYGVDFVLAKARTALGMRCSTIDLAASFLDRPSVVTVLTGAVGHEFLPMGGGVVIVSDNDFIVGAAAFSGALHEIDHAIAAAAVRSAGLQIKE